MEAKNWEGKDRIGKERKGKEREGKDRERIWKGRIGKGRIGRKSRIRERRIGNGKKNIIIKYIISRSPNFSPSSCVFGSVITYSYHLFNQKST